MTGVAGIFPVIGEGDPAVTNRAVIQYERLLTA